MQRSPEMLPERQQPGGVGHGRGDGHHLGVQPAQLDHHVGEHAGVGARLHLAHVVHVLDGVLLGGAVAAPLLGEHVDHDRPVELGRVGQRLLQPGNVVPVEGTEVAHAQVLEEAGRVPQLPQGGLRHLHAPLEGVTHPGDALGHLLEAVGPAHYLGVGAEANQALGEPRDGRRVAAAVVVEHDDHVAAAVADVVQPLEGHAPGQGSVAYDGHHPAPGVGRVEGGGQAVGVGQHGGCVAVLDPVVGGLGS